MLKKLATSAACIAALYATCQAAKRPGKELSAQPVSRQATAPVNLTTQSLMLVPMPREVRFEQGSLNLNGAQWRLKGDIDYVEQQDLSAQLREDFSLGLVEHSVTKLLVLTTQTLTGSEPPLYGSQGYTLHIEPNQVTIDAPSATGRFYGVQTLRQIARTFSKQGALPCMTIRDWPDLEWRGVSDDVSRGQVSTLDDFKNIIRQLAFYKKNLYQHYIEDMYQFDADPNIGAERGAITKRELAEIVAEGKRNHVVVSPVLECLGHQDRLLSLPENRKYAELQGAEDKPWSFAPTNPDALAFVTKLLDEVVDATPDSPFFHIGGDESWDVGKGVSKDRAKEIGIGRLHAEWFTKLHDHLASRGRQTLLYGDMLLNHPESLEVLPKDCIIIDWHYNANGPFPSVQKIRDLGFKRVITSPGLSSWSTFYPNYRNGFANIANFTAAGRAAGIIGSITSSWGDNGAENLRENNMLGFAYSAAVEWETTAPETDALIGRFITQQYSPTWSTMRGLTYGRQTDYRPTSPERVFDAIKVLGWGCPSTVNTWNSILHQNIRIKAANQDLVTSMQEVGKLAEASIRALAGSQFQNYNSLPTEPQIREENNRAFGPLMHSLRRVQYLSERVVVLDGVARKLGKRKISELEGTEQSDLRRDLEGLRDKLAQIIAEYPALWLRHNKYPKLDDNLTRLQSQLAQLQGFIAEAQAGELTAYPPIQGAWFWYPEPEPQAKATTGTKYFVREFDLASDPIKAQMRLFIDDSGRAFINGRGVAEASFGTGSVDRDALSNLKKGHNFLAVQATNEVGAAGVLLDLSIKLKDGSTMEITGDDQWKACDQKQDDVTWRYQPQQGDCWKPAKVLGPAPLSPWTDVE